MRAWVLDARNSRQLQVCKGQMGRAPKLSCSHKLTYAMILHVFTKDLHAGLVHVSLVCDSNSRKTLHAGLVLGQQCGTEMRWCLVLALAAVTAPGVSSIQCWQPEPPVELASASAPGTDLASLPP